MVGCMKWEEFWAYRPCIILQAYTLLWMEAFHLLHWTATMSAICFRGKYYLYLKAIADLPFTSRQIYVHMHIYTSTHIYMNIYTHIHEYTQTHTFQGHLPYRQLTKTVKNNRQSWLTLRMCKNMRHLWKTVSQESTRAFCV